MQLSSFRRQSGVSLIEVLVTLLILSISGLGMLGMSSLASKEVNQLKLDTTASQLGQALMARSLNHMTQTNAQVFTFDQNRALTAVDCQQGCNAQQLAQLHVSDWRQAVNTALPRARYATRLIDGALILDLAWAGPTQTVGQACDLQLADDEHCAQFRIQIPALD